MTARPKVRAFHDRKTGSVQYVVSDPATRAAAIIDPVWDFDEKSARTCTNNADDIIEYVRQEGLTVEWVLDTHPHADHFSAAPYLKAKLGGKTAIGEKVVEVQRIWKDIYNLPDLACDGSQWDKLFKDGEAFSIGQLSCSVMLCPGHTLASITYVIGDAAFVHDTLMVPDAGTSRADFPGGDAATLFESIQRILSLPDDTRIFVGHDYGRDGARPIVWESTVKAQREGNIHLRGSITKDHFIRLREARDAELPLPNLMLAALQVNIRGGRAPEPDSNGVRYLRIPMNKFEGFSDVCGCE